MKENHETRIPVIWYVLIITGVIYTIIGMLSFFLLPIERQITHLPAWLRRILDGITIVVIGLFAIQKPSIRPWREWFNHSWILYYSFLSLLIHYGGMLPPIYLYDYFPFFNKIMHINASIVILFLFTLGLGHQKPTKVDLLCTLLIGIAWEVTEFLTTPKEINYWTINDIGYGWQDTKGDLLANIIGIILGYIISNFNKNYLVDYY